jgi:hypothetical protein
VEAMIHVRHLVQAGAWSLNLIEWYASMIHIVQSSQAKSKVESGNATYVYNHSMKNASRGNTVKKERHETRTSPLVKPELIKAFR